MRLIKPLCFTLLVALSLSVPACSNFTASGRMDRAYYKHMKKIRVAKERRHKRMVRDIAKIPKPDAVPDMPVMTTSVEGPQAFPSQD